MATPHADRLFKMEAWRTSAMEDSHRHLTAVSEALDEIAAGNRDVAADLGLEGATARAACAYLDRHTKHILQASDRLKQIVKASTEALTAGIDAKSESIEIQAKLKRVNTFFKSMEHSGQVGSNVPTAGTPISGVTMADVEAQRQAAHAEIDALAKKALSNLDGRIRGAIGILPPDGQAAARASADAGDRPSDSGKAGNEPAGPGRRAGAVSGRLGRDRRHFPRRTRKLRSRRRPRCRRQRPRKRRRPCGRTRDPHERRQPHRRHVVAGHALRSAFAANGTPPLGRLSCRAGLACGVQPARLSRSHQRRNSRRRLQGLPSSPRRSSGTNARHAPVRLPRRGSRPHTDNDLGPLVRHPERSHHRRPHTNNNIRLNCRRAFARQCPGRGHRNRPTRPNTSLSPLGGHPERNHNCRAPQRPPRRPRGARRES